MRILLEVNRKTTNYKNEKELKRFRNPHISIFNIYMTQKSAPNDLLFTNNKEVETISRSSFYTSQNSKKDVLDSETNIKFTYK